MAPLSGTEGQQEGGLARRIRGLRSTAGRPPVHLAGVEGFLPPRARRMDTHVVPNAGWMGSQPAMQGTEGNQRLRGGRLCIVNKVGCPLVPTGGCAWLAGN